MGNSGSSVVIRGQPESPSRCEGARKSRCRWRHERPPVGKRGWRRGEHFHAGAVADGVTSAHLALISGHQWSSEVISGHQRSSVVTSAHLALAIRGNQRQSEAIRGNQRQSEALTSRSRAALPLRRSSTSTYLRCTQMHSDALRGTQRHSDARFVALACTIRCHQQLSSAGVIIRGHQMSSALISAHQCI